MLRRLHWRRFGAGCAFFTWIVVTSGAVVARGTVTFSTREAGCPASSYVDDRVARLVGPDAHDGGIAQVVVTKSQGRYDVIVSVQAKEARGERRFSADTCRLAADAAALIVAISMFPDRAQELTRLASPSNDHDGPAAPKPTAAVNVDRSASTGNVDRSTSFVFRSAAGAALDATSMPSAAFGPAVTVGLAIGRHVSVELSGGVFLSQTVRQTDTQSAAWQMQTAGVRGCYDVATTDVSFGPCIGATLVRLAGSGHGTDRTYEGTALFWGPSVGGVFRLRFSRHLTLRAFAEAFLPLARRPFLLDGAQVHRPSPLGASAFVGPELSF